MNTFFLLLIGLPALEIFIMIKIGAQIGAINTISLIFLTAIIGIYYARIQGIQTLKSGIANIYQNNNYPNWNWLQRPNLPLKSFMND